MLNAASASSCARTANHPLQRHGQVTQTIYILVDTNHVSGTAEAWVVNRKALVACNFNYHFETEGLLKVTASHVHCKCGNISETSTNSRWHWAYQIETILMTLSRLRGHSLLQAFQEWLLPARRYGCADNCCDRVSVCPSVRLLQVGVVG